ncbi:hypothetical protein [Eudoraea adriatica]|uniref:hypothetical protein n=1 Tax=Eudoraea adriatica TaxID=446681 RepID=UPI0003694E56|nr:hypothetical protein [Eudoraea adriatica]
MKALKWGLALTGIILIFVAAGTEKTSKLTSNFTKGNPGIASMDKLAFGPEGILLIGDTKNAAIYAINTMDFKEKSEAEEVDLEAFDQKIASSLGTTADQIQINDMAVNPISKSIYFSINIIDGTPVLLRLKGQEFEHISLQDVSYDKIELENAVGINAEDKRGRPLRVWAISDLKYHKGKVLVSGLSNKEFGSTFRSISFPFDDKQDYASLEIWHAAHGQYETHAPIKTFDIIELDKTDYLMASYTCTPLVLFPLDDLKTGVHAKGRTVAELGAGNSPLDMISYEKEGKKYFLMSNSNRPVMRIKYDEIADFKETLTEPVEEFAATEGVAYDNLPFPYVLQMDILDDKNVIYLQRTAEGDLVLRSRTTKWM